MGGAWIYGSPGSLGFPLSTGFLGVAASIALPCSAPLGDRFQSEGRARTSCCASTSCIRWTLSGVDSLAVEATPPLGPPPLGWTFLRWAGLHGLEGCDCLTGQDQDVIFIGLLYPSLFVCTCPALCAAFVNIIG